MSAPSYVPCRRFRRREVHSVLHLSLPSGTSELVEMAGDNRKLRTRVGAVAFSSALSLFLDFSGDGTRDENTGRVET